MMNCNCKILKNISAVGDTDLNSTFCMFHDPRTLRPSAAGWLTEPIMQLIGSLTAGCGFRFPPFLQKGDISPDSLHFISGVFESS